MTFNSIIYLVFLTFVVAAYYIFPLKIRWLWLLIASIAYYLSFFPVFILLLIFLAIANFFIAKSLAKSPNEKTSMLFVASIAMNILLLCLFKYFNSLFPDFRIHLYSVDFFFRTNVLNKMILPLGLSYLTFTILSYLIEIKRKTIQPETHFGYFSLYLFFFPKIAQGPIERPQNLINQLHQNPKVNYSMVAEGLKLILMGYFKKIVIADRLSIYVNAIYDNSSQHNGTSLAVATFFFAIQIYADFSGYTDIAIGSAKLFGINLSDNFKRPYFSTSIKEFWNRWHITFSTWLRDYIFLPLAYFLSGYLKKEKYFFISKEKWIYLIATLITFSICGIWHGVGWNYLFWGLLFGVYLTYSNWTKDLNKKIRKWLHIKKSSGIYLSFNVITTFVLILISWIFFRANSLQDAIHILNKIFTSSGPVFFHSPYDLVYAALGIAALIAIDIKAEYFNTQWLVLHNKHFSIRVAGIIILVIAILLLGVFDGGQFIYFQF